MSFPRKDILVSPRSMFGVALALAFVSTAAHADSVRIVSTRDNTLYESSAGNVSNGAGTGMFAGRTAQASNSRRRGLVRFDVAGAIPAGSTIQSVTLQLFCTTAALNAQATDLHRVLADWGEGASNAGDPGGGGAPAAANDATWTFRFFNAVTWATPGGDFAASVSGTASVAGPGPVAFASTAAMVADAQAWLDAPASNFGWLLAGNESVGGTAVRYETREGGDAGVPTLLVSYAPAATPAGTASWGRVKGWYR